MPRTQLIELYAYRVGVIDEVRLDFEGGFTVITGETGAGKTLLLGALALCLGRDSVASRYALSADSHVSALIVKDSEEFLVSREMTSSGRLRSSLNRVPASAETLRLLTQEMVAVHGQHESLTLTRRDVVLKHIDSRAGVDTSELESIRELLSDGRTQRQTLGGDAPEREKEANFVATQLAELELAKLEDPDELAKTLEALTRLTELRDGQAALATALTLFDSESDDAVLNRFAQGINSVPTGAAYEVPRNALRSALIQSREALRELAELADPDIVDSATMTRLETRVTLLQLVARKFGGSLGAAFVAREEFQTRLRMLADLDGALDALDSKIVALERREAELMAQIRLQRVESAQRLTDAVMEQFTRVALSNASLRIFVDGADGSDVQILFSANPGLPEGPLSMLASGGELSRLLLALSLVGTSEDFVAVFDEIDAGLGGQVAQQIGECLVELGRQQQVIAVTHLASVAARADHHFVIEKSVSAGQTRTIIRPVKGADRVRELARMLAGDDVTDESFALAQRMLQISQEVRPAPGIPR